jgi:NAD(P)-dependent dehydrogenase (short-subunit alcohol dehydrogenase family)
MADALPLAGMHAVVTGGGRGIGRAVAEHLATLGASLTLLGRDRARLYATVQALGNAANCEAQACDVRDETSVQAAFAAIARAGHRVAVLVNNAGRAASEADARATLAARNPQRRLTQPDEVARVVGWLCLPQSHSITGTALPVAGGEVT